MNILFDCERMKYKNIGLFHYCLNLGISLKKIIENEQQKMTFYYPSSEKKKYFGADANYLLQNSFHKLFFPNTKQFDIWHCTHQDSSYSPKNREIKKVLTIHDLNFLHEPNASQVRIEKRKKDIQLKIDQADHIITISKFAKQDIEQHLDLSCKPISVIYNGCSIHPQKELRTPIYTPKREFLFTIGTVTFKKNFHVLPRLLVNNTYELIIAGIISDKKYQEQIICEAKRLNVLDRIHFTQAISENDKQWYYSHCEAFVFPSLAEGFGLPIIEAMSFGKPIFLSTSTCLPEIGGDESYYFNNFEIEHMADILKKGLDDMNKNRHKKEQAYKNRSAQFSWDNCAQECFNIYLNLLLKK